MILKLYFVLVITIYTSHITSACSSFYCINSCGSRTNNKRSGYKLVLANNRDEDIFRPTWPANVWPPKTGSIIPDKLKCDISRNKAPYNLCVYGALDTMNGAAPDYYSTWLGINERGSLGNLLFFMSRGPYPDDTKPRGVIVGDYLQDSSWPNVDAFMQKLSDEKHLYKPFNYVQVDMSNTTGDYSLYYVNNNSTNTYKKMNKDNKRFIFGISNSDPQRPFKKVVNGQKEFGAIIDEYALTSNKEHFIDSMITLLQNTTSNMPDEILAQFMRKNISDPSDEAIIDGVSRIKANYSGYWTNGFTRTSTLILVDYDDNVEYFEYNLTKTSRNDTTENWTMNSFNFKLKPLYIRNSAGQLKLSVGSVCILLAVLFF